MTWARLAALPFPTPRAALALGAIALTALLLDVAVTVVLALALAGAAVADALVARRRPPVERGLPATLARGRPARLTATTAAPGAGRVTLRQAAPAALAVEPREGDGGLDAVALPLRRGRHRLPGLWARTEGPLGLAAAHHAVTGDQELAIYPDLPTARRIALAVRSGRFREEGRRGRGPLGLGTELESVRDYSPDDDIRQVNWRATARLGRPMSNQYRVEQDRDLLCLIDCGRLMAAPTGAGSRLDAALDAVAAVGLVADALGDRCGAVAFDSAVLRELTPRRAGGAAAVRALFDLEPSAVDSDYELAFRCAGARKRSLVLVLTDILEETAARPLVDAVPVLARRHVVVIASATDPELRETIVTAPERAADVHAQVVALDEMAARRRVRSALAGTGAEVVEALPRDLGGACVRAYLRAKARARL